MTSQLPERLVALLPDRYALQREVGSGGMATVYLAADRKHGRQVAIKVLHPELASTIGPDRFLREIEIAARLNHPHILPLYDSDASEGMFYYVMPFVRGETLRQKLARDGRLPVDDAVGIARQVASALHFAHCEGVLHRDIKPENILLHEGVAMVADFGIALAVHDAVHGRRTETGLLLGTPEYMSPEQAAGEARLDARTDVYSLGCVLFEMLAGAPPFAGRSARAVLTRRIVEAAPSMRRLRSDVPGHVERALLQALARDPGDRFGSMELLSAALVRPHAPAPEAPTVAVLPFVNLSTDPENEYFADGITEDVITQLAKIRALKVISRTSVMRFKTSEKSLKEIGAALEASTIVEGSVRRAGDKVRIVAQLIDVETDQHLWADVYDRQLTDIFAIQTDVALHIAGALQTKLSSIEKDRIRREPTSDLEAYQLYLRARECHIRFTLESLREALQYYEEAASRDPEYAMAHVGIALVLTELGEWGAIEPEEAYGRAKDRALRALAIDGELGQAHCVVGQLHCVHDFDWAGAERAFKRALDLMPGNADIFNLYGRLCSALDRHEESIAMQRRAQELDPLVHRVDLATAYLRAGRYDEAIGVTARALELDPREPRALATQGWALLLSGARDEGLEHLETAASLAEGDTLWLAQLGQAYGVLGEIERAREVLERLEDLRRREYVSPYHMAYVHTGLGDAERAIDFLEQAFEERAGAVYGIKSAFLFHTLRGHPRFTALLGRLNLA